MEKMKLTQGNKDGKPSDASRTNNGFKSKFGGKPPFQKRDGGNRFSKPGGKFGKPGRRNV